MMLLMFTRKAMALVVAASLMAASFASFCRYMNLTMADMAMSPMAGVSIGCGGSGPASCAGEHMETFFQSVPASRADILLGVIACAVVAWFISHPEDFQGRIRSFVMAVKQLFRYLRRVLEPPPLAFAFQRGILHSKRYA